MFLPLIAYWEKPHFASFWLLMLSTSYVLLTSESLAFLVSSSQTLLLDSFPLPNLLPAFTLLFSFSPTSSFIRSLPFSSLSHCCLHSYQVTVQKSCSECQKFPVPWSTLLISHREHLLTLVTVFAKCCDLSAHNNFRCALFSSTGGTGRRWQLNLWDGPSATLEIIFYIYWVE